MKGAALEERLKELDEEIHSLLVEYYEGGKKDKSLVEKANKLGQQYTEMNAILSNIRRGKL